MVSVAISLPPQPPPSDPLELSMCVVGLPHNCCLCDAFLVASRIRNKVLYPSMSRT